MEALRCASSACEVRFILDPLCSPRSKNLLHILNKSWVLRRILLELVLKCNYYYSKCMSSSRTINVTTVLLSKVCKVFLRCLGEYLGNILTPFDPMVKFPDIYTAVTFFFFFLIQVISLLISQAVHKSPTG